MGSDDIGFKRSIQFHFGFYLIIEGVVALFIIDLFIDTFCPVVGSDGRIALYHIAVYVELSPYMFHWLPCIRSAVGIGTVCRSSYADLGDTVTYCTLRGCGTWFVVVVYDVYFHTFTTITSIACPVVEYIVAQVHILPFLCSRTRAKAGYTAFVVSHQVVMIRCMGTSPVTAIPVFPFAVSGSAQAFGDKTPLYRCVFRTIYGQAFVNRPADRTVVYNDIFFIHTSQTIRFSTGSYACCSYPETQVTENDIVGRDDNRIIRQADSLSRSTLSGNGNIVIGDFQITLQVDGSGYIEDNGACPFLLYSIA